MTKLFQLARGLSWCCLVVAGIALVGLMGITVLDVITRWLFRITQGGLGFTLRGSVEMVRYLLYLSLLSAMAASVERSQVVVELFTQKLAERFKHLLGSFYLLGFALLAALLTYGSWQEAFDSLEYGEVTQDLAMPVGPIYFAASGLFAIMAVRSLIHALGGLLGVTTASAQGEALS